MRLIIREYREEDRPELIRLMEELQDYLVGIDQMKFRRRMPEYGESYTSELLQSIDLHEGKIFMAEADGNIIGCIAGIIQRPTEQEELGWVRRVTGRIEELHVSDSHRGQGVGRKLMEAMETYCKDHGCTLLRVEVLSDNRSAHEFYEKLGYADRFVDMLKTL